MKSYLVLVNHKKWLWWLSQACGVHVNRTQERGAGCFIKDPLELTCYKNILLVLLDFFLFFFKKPYKFSVVSMVEEKQLLFFFSPVLFIYLWFQKEDHSPSSFTFYSFSYSVPWINSAEDETVFNTTLWIWCLYFFLFFA